jgi:KipI family sensor histidine kinase inhibitor
MTPVLLSDRAVLISGLATEEVGQVERHLSHYLPRDQIRRGLDSVLVSCATPSPSLLDAVHAALSELHPRNENGTALSLGTPRVIPVRYDGVDLHDVCALLEVSPERLITLHTETLWQVQMIGFAPGFPYLAPQGETFFDLPRRDTPRTQVPAGSVGIAAGLSCIYPSAMPGGWWLIGHTHVTLFDAGLAEPALLRAGDAVRFEAQAP